MEYKLTHTAYSKKLCKMQVKHNIKKKKHIYMVNNMQYSCSLRFGFVRRVGNSVGSL